MRRRGHRLLTTSIPIVLVVLALTGFLLSAASIPHTHNPGQPGFYNQEHDLSYLATFGGVGLSPDVPSAAPPAVLVALAVVLASGAPPIVSRRLAGSRAPPLP